LRIRLRELRGRAEVKQDIEQRLSAGSGVRAVRASAVTGTVLIEFAPEIPAESILADIRRGLRAGSIPRRPPDPHWHQLSVAQALHKLAASSAQGLSDHAARERLLRDGPNRLQAGVGRRDLEILIGQLRSLPVAVLGGAAAMSVAAGSPVEAAVILGVIGFNAALGFTSEKHIERTISALARPAQARARVMRGGALVDLPVEDIVCGDIIDLAPGTVLPADARLIGAENLTVNEAVLTGESLPAAKTSARLPAANPPLAERRNIVYRGTMVTTGRGAAVVVATGDQTAIGQIQALSAGTRSPETPLQRQLGRLGSNLIAISAAACGAVLLAGLLRGQAFFDLLRASVALAVAAVPEGLPVLATSTLALGVGELRRHRALVRSLDVVEALGAVDVVCFDKTGTLTANRMTVVAIALAGRPAEPCGVGLDLDLRDRAAEREGLLRLAALCNEADIVRGDGGLSFHGSPTEAALLQAAVDHGLDPAGIRLTWPRLSLQPRSAQRQFMVSVHAGRDGSLTAVKGNPSQVLAMCRWQLIDGRRFPVGPEDREAIESENSRLGSRAFRSWVSPMAGPTHPRRPRPMG
jgi:Ca2+-transporting ATPase